MVESVKTYFLYTFTKWTNNIKCVLATAEQASTSDMGAVTLNECTT